MGAWDTAADRCGDLVDTNPRDRQALRRAALARAANEHDHLDSDFACGAIASAAILAGQLPEVSRHLQRAPEFLRDGGRLRPQTICQHSRCVLLTRSWPTTPTCAIYDRATLPRTAASPSTQAAIFERCFHLRRGSSRSMHGRVPIDRRLARS